MTAYEYKVVPAPKKGLRGKGLKGAEAKFANALMQVMNTLGADGWEYQRTDTLPCEERRGLTGKATVFQNMLVFRRVLPAQAGSDVAHAETKETVLVAKESTPLKLASPVLVAKTASETDVSIKATSDVDPTQDKQDPVRLVTKLRSLNDDAENTSVQQG